MLGIARQQPARVEIEGGDDLPVACVGLGVDEALGVFEIRGEHRPHVIGGDLFRLVDAGGGENEIHQATVFQEIVEAVDRLHLLYSSIQ